MKTNFYGMEKYAEKVTEAFEKGLGTVEIELDKEVMGLEVRALHRKLHERDTCILSVGGETYAFPAGEVRRNGLYGSLKLAAGVDRAIYESCLELNPAKVWTNQRFAGYYNGEPLLEELMERDPPEGAEAMSRLMSYAWELLDGHVSPKDRYRDILEKAVRLEFTKSR